MFSRPAFRLRQASKAIWEEITDGDIFIPFLPSPLSAVSVREATCLASSIGDPTNDLKLIEGGFLVLIGRASQLITSPPIELQQSSLDKQEKMQIELEQLLKLLNSCLKLILGS